MTEQFQAQKTFGIRLEEEHGPNIEYTQKRHEIREFSPPKLSPLKEFQREMDQKFSELIGPTTTFGQKQDVIVDLSQYDEKVEGLQNMEHQKQQKFEQQPPPETYSVSESVASVPAYTPDSFYN